MKNEIKELRVKIDGIAQLVKELKPQSQYRLNINAIPDGVTANKFIYAFREHGWGLYDAQKAIEPIPQQFKEIEKSYDSLILAKAWLGKVLGELGEETPYKNDGKRKAVEDIEDAADTAITYTQEGLETGTWIVNGNKITNHIEKVDCIREEIKVLINHILDRKGRVSGIVMTVDRAINDEDYLGKERDKDYNCWFAINQSYKYLQEARFWLGFELQRVKEDE